MVPSSRSKTPLGFKCPPGAQYQRALASHISGFQCVFTFCIPDLYSSTPCWFDPVLYLCSDFPFCGLCSWNAARSTWIKLQILNFWKYRTSPFLRLKTSKNQISKAGNPGSLWPPGTRLSLWLPLAGLVGFRLGAPCAPSEKTMGPCFSTDFEVKLWHAVLLKSSHKIHLEVFHHISFQKLFFPDMLELRGIHKYIYIYII